MQNSIQLPELQKCTTQFWQHSQYSLITNAQFKEYSMLFRAANAVDRHKAVNN